MNKKFIIIALTTIIVLFVVVISINYYRTAFIRIETSPENTTIMIDKKIIKDPGERQRVTTGRHIITISAEDYIEKKYEVSFSSREAKLIKVELKRDISKYLPENNDHFKVEFIQENDKSFYRITLYAIINRPDQLEEYRSQLKEYKKEALGWLKEKGIEPSNSDIKWVPEEKYIDQ